jgi:hypothetical protein
MVDKIRESAAMSGNVKVFKWPSGMTSIVTEIGMIAYIYEEVAENGHKNILELADRKELDWYNKRNFVS